MAWPPVRPAVVSACPGERKPVDRIGQLGISWRNGGPGALARFTVPVEERGEWLRRFAERTGIRELVYLATCNRVELVFVGDGSRPLAGYRRPFYEHLTGERPGPGVAERTFHAWGGEGAAEHLFLTACGLDSARIGESEIAHQVREAYELSRSIGFTGPRLDLLFDEALKVAKRVHTRSAIGEGRQSLAGIALDHVRTRLDRTPGPVALIGVSAMTERCAHALREGGTTVCIVNRTIERAENLALTIGAEARSLKAFLASPDPVEAVVSATGAPGPVLSGDDLVRLAGCSASGEPPLLIDLAIPPDIAPGDAGRAGLVRIGMDEVLREAERNRKRRLVEAADARTIVDDALVGLRRRMIDRILAPLFAAVQERFRETARDGVERLLSKELSGLSAAERDAVRRWGEAMARRMAHLPTAGLRGIAFDIGPEAVEAFLAKADQSMIDILREAAGRSDLPRADEDGTP